MRAREAKTWHREGNPERLKKNSGANGEREPARASGGNAAPKLHYCGRFHPCSGPATDAGVLVRLQGIDSGEQRQARRPPGPAGMCIEKKTAPLPRVCFFFSSECPPSGGGRATRPGHRHTGAVASSMGWSPAHAHLEGRGRARVAWRGRKGAKRGGKAAAGAAFFRNSAGGGRLLRRGSGVPLTLSHRAPGGRAITPRTTSTLTSFPLLCCAHLSTSPAKPTPTPPPSPPPPPPLHFFRHRRQDQGRPRPRRQHAKDGKGQGLPRQPGRHAGGQVAGALLSCLGLFFKARGPSGTALSSTRARAVRGRRSPARACPGGRPWS